MIDNQTRKFEALVVAGSSSKETQHLVHAICSNGSRSQHHVFLVMPLLTLIMLLMLKSIILIVYV